MMKFKRLTAILSLFALMLSLCCGCSRSEKYSASFVDTFDTVITLYGYTADATKFNEYAKLCHTEFQYYNQLFDIYNDYEGVNNLKTINDNAGGDPVFVSSDIVDLLTAAKTYYKNTNGKVNVAMGSVLSIWHNYREKGLETPAEAALPSMSILSAASNTTDINDIEIDASASTVRLAQSGMSLDVGAIAKGYACQKVAMKLKDSGFESFVISAGGNVYACGYPLDTGATKWSIGIQNPDTTGSAAVVDTLLVSDMAVVTAGGYQRYYTVDGVNYCHIIDPETLMPCNKYLSVTVIADNSAFADFMATTLYLTDYEEGLELCRKLGVEALWITDSGQKLVSDGYFDYSSEAASN